MTLWTRGRPTSLRSNNGHMDGNRMPQRWQDESPVRFCPTDSGMNRGYHFAHSREITINRHGAGRGPGARLTGASVATLSIGTKDVAELSCLWRQRREPRLRDES